MHSIRWQLDSVCCHRTCQHWERKYGVGWSRVSSLSKINTDRYKQTQTWRRVWINLNVGETFSAHIQQEKSKAALAVLVLLTVLLSRWGAGTASHASLFASVFTGFNTSVPCHIPEHIQISPWHFTHCWLHCFIMLYHQSGAHNVKVYANIEWRSGKNMSNTFLIVSWTSPSLGKNEWTYFQMKITS